MLEKSKMKKTIYMLCATLLGTCSGQALASNASAATNIQVLGLFKNTAVLNIDNQRTVMRVGDKRQGKVRLLAADSEKAIFDVSGRRVQLSLAENQAIRTDLPSSGGHQAQLVSSGGLYSVPGSINGQLADFVVDTGASYVTMSLQQAKALHLDYSNARVVSMNTANGKASAHVFTVKSVRIGGIELHNVEAAVMGDMASSKILLGMSFLSQVNMKHGPGLMVLSERK